MRRRMRKKSTITSGPEPEGGAVESPPRETIRKPTGRRNDPGNEWDQSGQAPWSKASDALANVLKNARTCFESKGRIGREYRSQPRPLKRGTRASRSRPFDGRAPE